MNARDLFQCQNCDKTDVLHLEIEPNRAILRCDNCRTGWTTDVSLPEYPHDDDALACPHDPDEFERLDKTTEALIYARARYARSAQAAVKMNATTGLIEVTDNMPSPDEAKAKVQSILEELTRAIRDLAMTHYENPDLADEAASNEREVMQDTTDTPQSWLGVAADNWTKAMSEDYADIKAERDYIRREAGADDDPLN